MRLRRPRVGLRSVRWGVAYSCLALWLAGCNSAQTVTPADSQPAAAIDTVAEEARQVAEASLGKQAEVLARGDLAQNGLEQVLAVNRFTKNAQSIEGRANSSAIFVTRAEILERNGGKWSQVLLCDEHLKNPRGYLAGSRSALANGWRLEYRQDPKAGLVLKFTPAEHLDAVHTNADESTGEKVASFEVRWNKSTKRYQSFDQSHERYLSEVPSLETPESILK